jgi:protoheme IX farnesyltransferase
VHATAIVPPAPAGSVCATGDPCAHRVRVRRSMSETLCDFGELAKLRMNILVVATTLVGCYMSRHGLPNHYRLLATLLGTALTSAAAGALNQYVERAYDALMLRTANRPLPAGRLQPIHARLFGLTMMVGGILCLRIFVNPLTAQLALITITIYLLLYTPAKRRTPWCTIIGAVPGAMPAMMGVTAGDGSISSPGLALFAIVFCWQIPHFLAIAILYSRDYAAGGFLMLPVVDPSLKLTARRIVGWSLALVLATLLPVLLHMTGSRYLAGALILNTAFLALAITCACRATRVCARRLFFASIVYLPLLMAVMALDRQAAPVHRNVDLVGPDHPSEEVSHPYRANG